MVADLERSSFGFCGLFSSSFFCPIFGSTFSFNLLPDLPFFRLPFFGCLSIDLDLRSLDLDLDLD